MCTSFGLKGTDMVKSWPGSSSRYILLHLITLTCGVPLCVAKETMGVLAFSLAYL